MRVAVNDPALVDDLGAWLERVRCLVTRLDDRTLEVEAPKPIPIGWDDLQLELFLRVWEVRHGQRARAHRVPEPPIVNG